MSQTTTPSGADVLDVITHAACSVAYLAKIRRDAGHALAANIYDMESQEIDQARTAVAALIARNAELEAEREAGKFRSTNRDVVLSDPRPLAERLRSYARQFGNETIFARTIAALLLEAHTALTDRDDLAAENKAPCARR